MFGFRFWGKRSARVWSARVDDTAETARTFENFGLNFEVTDLFGFMQAAVLVGNASGIESLMQGCPVCLSVRCLAGLQGGW